ncbi:caprin homolog isoform X2 [Bacillus rossius redtenbacheri]|uniref:caprin homolog isoform X2 n=1 Tax=Bacillus rossius redtenbacheri TaxID=93214 RepID=UPI002FDE68C1
MPSAANAKLEKQVSTETSDPFRQAFTAVEHKIRNLEKRKKKIELYQEEQKNGKTLNSDQLSAVARFDEVSCTLENLRELLKQFSAIAAEQARLQKKLARKEALERAQQDLTKIKEILVVQDVLQNMGQDNVREDFLAGRNGAVQLTEDDLKYLDDLYLEISLKRGVEEGLPSFEEQLQQCAEHLLSIVDGKVKDIVGTTYGKLKELIGTIQSCGYFDHVSEEAPTEQVEEVKTEVVEEAAAMEEVEEVVQEQAPTQPETTFPKGLVPPQAVPVPVPVAVVESSFFTTAAVPVAFPSNPSQPPPTPLNEFISSGGIDFIQESELDSSEVAILSGPLLVPQRLAATPPPVAALPVAPIPTQTFTNQSFAAVPTAAHKEEGEEARGVPEQPALVAAEGEGWSKLEGGAGGDWSQQSDNQGDWSQQSDNAGDWSQQSDQTNTADWSAQPGDQSDGYITQGGSRSYGGRGGRGNRAGRGSGTSGGGYSGNRGRAGYQNGRGGANYGYRGSEGGNYYQQNGYQQREREGYNSYGGGGFKRGGPRGGTARGGDRGGIFQIKWRRLL